MMSLCCVCAHILYTYQRGNDLRSPIPNQINGSQKKKWRHLHAGAHVRPRGSYFIATSSFRELRTRGHVSCDCELLFCEWQQCRRASDDNININILLLYQFRVCGIVPARIPPPPLLPVGFNISIYEPDYATNSSRLNLLPTESCCGKPELPCTTTRTGNY